MKKYLTIISVIPFFWFNNNFKAQNEFSKWYFGNQAGLDFNTSPPTILTNGAQNTPEGVATMCDNNGNLLFYAQADGVFNSSHVGMANGTGLLGNQSSAQAVTAVKQPGNNSNYYVFTIGNGANGLRYSIVDMNLAAGMGSVTIKNVPINSLTCEMQVIVRHCNGMDAWVVSHDINSNQFRSHLLTNAGLNPIPILSPTGEYVAERIGQLKISPDGKKLAMSTLSATAQGNSGFQLFDFDASSGIVSNSLTLISGTTLQSSINTGAYGVEFSPDGTKVFGTTSSNSATLPESAALFQWNLCAGSNSAIVASQYSVGFGGYTTIGSIQRASNGKLYVVIAGTKTLSVVNNPNLSGPAMNFVLNGQPIAPKLGTLGLPNFINGYQRVPLQPFSSTVACQSASFSVPPVPTFSSGCSSTPYTPSSYLWNFGEPSSGAANSSTLTTPVHNYSTTGTYSVSLILYSNCINDTIRTIINISTLNPTVNVTGIFDICKGEKRTYTVTGGTTYQWSNNATTATTTFAPITTTMYSVSGFSNGCSASKSFTVNVNPCLGIAASEMNAELRVYPNPVKDQLTIDSPNQLDMFVYDITGRLIKSFTVEPGRSEINVAELKPGAYTLKANRSQWQGKLIKVE